MYYVECHVLRRVHGHEPNVVHGSPGRIRTYNLFLTETLLLPKGLDYLIHVQFT